MYVIVYFYIAVYCGNIYNHNFLAMKVLFPLHCTCGLSNFAMWMKFAFSANDIVVLHVHVHISQVLYLHCNSI